MADTVVRLGEGGRGSRAVNGSVTVGVNLSKSPAGPPWPSAIPSSATAPVVVPPVMWHYYSGATSDKALL